MAIYYEIFVNLFDSNPHPDKTVFLFLFHLLLLLFFMNFIFLFKTVDRKTVDFGVLFDDEPSFWIEFNFPSW
jgi:hypothetical protein